MKNFMIMLAKNMPQDKLIFLLKRSIEEYEKNPTKKNKSEMTFNIILLHLQLATEDKDMEEVMKEFEEGSQILEHFRSSTTKN